jgi:hypothetical protein
VLQDEVEAAEPAAPGAVEAAGQRGQGAAAPARGTRGGPGLLPADLPGTLSCYLQLPDHSGRHIPQCHVCARLPTVAALFLLQIKRFNSSPFIICWIWDLLTLTYSCFRWFIFTNLFTIIFIYNDIYLLDYRSYIFLFPLRFTFICIFIHVCLLSFVS